VLLARRAAQDAGLNGVQVVTGDASLTDAYVGAVPADLVLVCGVFGNISTEDIQRTIASLPQLCAVDATVIWTRHCLSPDITPTILEVARDGAPRRRQAGRRVAAAPSSALPQERDRAKFSGTSPRNMGLLALDRDCLVVEHRDHLELATKRIDITGDGRESGIAPALEL
jgi:hypothetical protein